ncbi:MAG: hypothetical protein QXL19_10505 [Ignisphaera sp.]
MKIYLAILLILIPITIIFNTVFSNTASVEFLGDIRIIPCGYNSVAQVSGGARWNAQPIGNASIDPNIWNIRSYEGGVVMRCSAGGPLVVNSNISLSTNLGNTYAYHEIIYGPKPWGMPSNHPSSIHPVKLPEPLSVYINEKRLIMYTKFNIERLDQSTNFAYDIWITESPRYTGGPGTNDVELMIWVYRAGNRSVNAPMPVPAGSIVMREYIPTLINGNLVNASWSIWYKPDVEWGGWDYIAFVLATPSTDVAIDLTEILKIMVKVLGQQKPGLYGSDGSKLYSYYINNIEFGTEVFSYTAGPSGIRWVMEKFYLVAFRATTSSQNALSYVADNYVKQPPITITTPQTETQTPITTPLPITITEDIQITTSYVYTTITQIVTYLIRITDTIEKTYTVTDKATHIYTVTNIVTEVTKVVEETIETRTKEITETIVHYITLTEKEPIEITTTETMTTTAIIYVTQSIITTVSEISWSLTTVIAIVLLVIGIGIGYVLKKR